MDVILPKMTFCTENLSWNWLTTYPAKSRQLPGCLDAAKSGFAGQSHLAGVTDSFIKTEANYMELLWDMLPDTLSSRQKNGRINTILTYMRRKNIIKTDSDNHQLSNWILV